MLTHFRLDSIWKSLPQPDPLWTPDKWQVQHDHAEWGGEVFSISGAGPTWQEMWLDSYLPGNISIQSRYITHLKACYVLKG